MKVKCDQPGCKWTYEHSTPLTAHAMVGKHKRKAHGIRSPNEHYWKKPSPKQTSNSAFEVEPEPQPKPRKQKNTPRVNFCPDCGCNLHAVAVAMGLGRAA